jgi:hypothetical protein
MHRKLTTAELERLEAAQDYIQLSRIGLDILSEMASHGRSVIMISGPMSTGGAGSLQANMDRFNRAIEQARRRGFFVFDQTPFQDAMIRISKYVEGVSEYDHDILHVFYRALLQSGNIHEVLFLDDWQSSIGATWEHEECERLGIKTDDYPMEWIIDDAPMPTAVFTREQVIALCGGRLSNGNGFAWERVTSFQLLDGILQPFEDDEMVPGPGIEFARLRRES